MNWIINHFLQKLKDESGIFGLFKKTPKVSATPDIAYPTQEQLHFTTPLRTLAQQRIQAGTTGEETPGVGFGKDFLSQATNPAIKEIRRQFSEESLPQLSSQQSARGIARSSIATDQIAREQRVAQGNIEQLLANFYVLNEQQKKSDITEGLNLGIGLQNQQAGMKADQAAASERLVERTAAGQLSRAKSEQDRLNAIGDAAIGLVGGGISGGIGGGGLKNILLGASGGAMGNNAILNQATGIKTATLGSIGDDDLLAKIIEMLGR